MPLTPIKLPDGRLIPWLEYRRWMLTPRSRTTPVAAYDSAAPLSGSQQRLGNSDQEPGGRLDGPYLRATARYLADHGLSDEDVSTVMEILGRYAEEDNGPLPRIGEDALRRAMAADRALPVHLRRWPAPAMTARQEADFEKRFPGISRIKVV